MNTVFASILLSCIIIVTYYYTCAYSKYRKGGAVVLEYLFLSKQTTIYTTAKELGIPYTAINRIVKGTTDLGKASVSLLVNLSKYLKISMDELYNEYIMDKYIRESQWNTFISNLQHQIKSEGELSFIRFCITSHFAERCFLNKQYDKGLYVVSAVDYLCRISNIPSYSGYEEMRKWKLEETKFPEDIEQIHNSDLKEKLKRNCMEECLPEFKRANIMEKGVRHVI